MRFVIDGNNLVHAFAGLARPSIGRQHLCEVVGRWGSRAAAEVVIVFDGPAPPSGVRQQMQCGGLEVVFSESDTADEVIEELIDRAASPANLCVVTSDRAVASAGRRRRCRWITSQDFVRVLTEPVAERPSREPPRAEKPGAPGPEEAEEWLRRFGLTLGDPDDLTDLMR